MCFLERRIIITQEEYKIAKRAKSNKYIEHEDYYELVITSLKYGILHVFIDKEDYDKVKRIGWSKSKCWNKDSNVTPKYYAMGNITVDGKHTSIMMHRYIMNAPKGKSVDHIIPVTDEENDNRKEFLRICTQSENRQNYKGINPNNTSGYLGVTWNKREEKWQAYLHGKTKYYNLGLYDNIEDAVAARRAGEEKYFTIHNDVVA
jgi:hypothetical protein